MPEQVHTLGNAAIRGAYARCSTLPGILYTCSMYKCKYSQYNANTSAIFEIRWKIMKTMKILILTHTQCYEHNKNEILKIITYITGIFTYIHTYIILQLLNILMKPAWKGMELIIDKLRINEAEGN